MFLDFLKDTFFPLILGAGGGLAIVYFLGKKVIDQILKKEILKYKSELEEKTVVLKSNLSIFAKEQDVANRRIDSQKSEAIHQVYQLICKTITPITRIIAGSPFVNVDEQVHAKFYLEQSELCHKNAENLMDALYINAIYFKSDIYDKIVQFSHLVMTANAKLLRVMRRVPPEYLTTEEVRREIVQEISNIKEISESNLQQMHQDLLVKFREILGIEK